MINSGISGSVPSDECINEYFDKKQYKKTIKACLKAFEAVKGGWKVGNRYELILDKADQIRYGAWFENKSISEDTIPLFKHLIQLPFDLSNIKIRDSKFI